MPFLMACEDDNNFDFNENDLYGGTWIGNIESNEWSLIFNQNKTGVIKYLCNYNEYIWYTEDFEFSFDIDCIDLGDISDYSRYNNFTISIISLDDKNMKCNVICYYDYDVERLYNNITFRKVAF